jgi:hypothetical protein
MVEIPQGVDPGGGLVMQSVFDVCPTIYVISANWVRVFFLSGLFAPRLHIKQVCMMQVTQIGIVDIQTLPSWMKRG